MVYCIDFFVFPIKKANLYKIRRFFKFATLILQNLFLSAIYIIFARNL